MVILRVSGISSSVVDNNSSFWITSTMPVGMSCGFFLFLVTWTTLLFGGSIVSLCIFTKLLFSLFFTCDVSCWRQKNIAFLCDSSTATRAPPTFIVYSTSYVHCTCFFMIKNELICILGIYVKKVFQSFLVDLQSCLPRKFVLIFLVNYNFRIGQYYYTIEVMYLLSSLSPIYPYLWKARSWSRSLVFV